MTLAAQTISCTVSDVSNQKSATVDNIPVEATVGELMESVLSKMKLPKNDTHGRPLIYQALNQTAGRHVRVVEKVGDAIKPNDHIIFQPDIDAGV